MAEDLPLDKPKKDYSFLTDNIPKNQPKWQPGYPRSVRRLARLGFDPIGELVDKYRKLEGELEYQEKLRSGAIVELRSDGKPRAYRAETHMAIYDKLIAVSEKLLRYNYGRVPELNLVEERKPTPLIVNLTKKGEVYTVNDESQQITGDIYDDQERD